MRTIKMKRVLTFVAVVAMCMSVYAQWDSPEMNEYMRTNFKQMYEVRGKVYGMDEFEPKPYPLQGANVKVVCLGDTTKMEGESVWKDGHFKGLCARGNKVVECTWKDGKVTHHKVTSR